MVKYHYTEDQLPEIGKVVIGYFAYGERVLSYECYLLVTGWKKWNGDDSDLPYAWCEKPAPPPVKPSTF